MDIRMPQQPNARCRGRRFYAPERDMELVHNINPNRLTWAEYLRKTGFDGTQSEEDIRAKFVT